MQFAPGTDAVLEATFTTPTGTAVDPSILNVDLYDAGGTKLVEDGTGGTLLHLGTGTYRFTYALPGDAPVGLWRIEWEATIGGLLAIGAEEFDVAVSDAIVTPGDELNRRRLRSRLDEIKIDDNGDGSDTFFTDVALDDLLAYAGDDLNIATLEGWLRKEARYSRLVDISESGSERKLSQRFRQAQQMVAFWSGLIGKNEGLHAKAISGRIVGRVMSLREQPCDTSPYPFFDGENIREYPTHRLICPAILG